MGVYCFALSCGSKEGYRGDGVGHDSRPGHFGVAEIGASDVL